MESDPVQEQVTANFILRVFEQKLPGTDPARVAGIMQIDGNRGWMVFGSVDELWVALRRLTRNLPSGR